MSDMLTPEYKLFLLSIYFVGVLTGGVIGAIILNIKQAQWRQREEK